MKEAMFYTTGKENEVICELCNHHCHIKEGKRGICGVRENRDGVLYSLVYGRLIAENIDPIEKKPLFNFLPGSKAFSISTVGCNFHCLHCQNYDISQYPHAHNGEIAGTERTSEAVVEEALQTGCASVCYTYVEPTIFYEFAYDCSVIAHDRQLKNVFVSNGYMTSEVTRHLAPMLDGINIDDVKSEGMSIRIGGRVVKLEITDEVSLPEDEIRAEYSAKLTEKLQQIKGILNEKMSEMTYMVESVTSPCI